MSDVHEKMFGCSLEELKSAFDDGLLSKNKAMLVMSMLSDAQECMSLALSEIDAGQGVRAKSRLEQSRQILNRAKFGVSEYLDTTIEKEVENALPFHPKTVDGKIHLLSKPVKVEDSDGNKWNVLQIYVEQEGYIADVNVVVERKKSGTCAGDAWICDDGKFVSGIMLLLEKAGYAGRHFGRAESGMQGDDIVVLEPPKQFCVWMETLGWVDQDKKEKSASKRKPF